MLMPSILQEALPGSWPLLWFGLGGLLFLFLAGKQQNLIVSILCFGLILYLVHNLYQKNHEIWSPYYKINHYQNPVFTSINVNGSFTSI